MRIKELAKRVGVKESILRFYEDKGLLFPKRDDNGYRNYTESDVETVLLILLYRKMGFSIEHIKALFADNEKLNRLSMFFKQQKIINHQIREMEIMREGISSCLDQMLLSTEEDIDAILKQSVGRMQSINEWIDHWHFDSWAEEYDDVVHTPNKDALPFYEHYEEVLNQCAACVNEVKGKVLEIGIGTGNLASRIAAVQEIYGIDQSIEMLVKTKQKYAAIPVRYGTFANIPFASHTFTTIVSSYAFHHNQPKERKEVLQEMDRVLMEKGRIIICDLMFENQKAKESYETTCTQRQKKELADEYFITVDELKKHLQSMKYKVQAQNIDNLIWIVTGTKN